MSNIVHVVLTGGVGSRLWPLSRKNRPKQYLDLFSGFSLFENTISRNKNIAQKLIVVGNKDNIELSHQSLVKLDRVTDATNIVESTPRNTAAAIAFAAFSADPEDVLIITPSDHVITGEQKYEEALNKAILLAKEGALVTFGIEPSRPDTGFGYIEYNKGNVVSFREKPDLKTAEEFIQKGNFCWNSGMFCFKARVFLEELKKYEPEVYKKSSAVWELNKEGYLDLDLSMEIPSISVDYAVMERSEKIKVVASSFEWSDLGSFESLYDYLLENNYKIDNMGNMVIGTDKHTSFVGVKNCILVYSEDALLVLNKDSSQDVKKIYQDIEAKGSNLV